MPRNHPSAAATSVDATSDAKIPGDNDTLAPMPLAGSRSTRIFGARLATTRPVVRSLLTAVLLCIGGGVLIAAIVRGPIAVAPVVTGVTLGTVAKAPVNPSHGAGTDAAAVPVPPQAVGVSTQAHATVQPTKYPGAIRTIPAPIPVTPPCTTADFRLSATVTQAATPGTVTLAAHLANISGHACISHGDTWRVDFTTAGTPPRGLDGTGLDPALSTGGATPSTVVRAGTAENDTWNWNEQDCSGGTCVQVAPGTYRAALQWNGLSTVVLFTLQ
jgi:hypothetical protein